MMVIYDIILFAKGKSVTVGEQLEFDRYLVTLESILTQATITSKNKEVSNTPEVSQVTEPLSKPKYNPRFKRGLLKSIKRDLPKDQTVDEKDSPGSSTTMSNSNEDVVVSVGEEKEEVKQDLAPIIQPKRRRVGLSRSRGNELPEKSIECDVDAGKDNPQPDQEHKSKFKPLAIQRSRISSEAIRYPGKDECFKMSQNNGIIVRTGKAPTFFKSIIEYKSAFDGLLREHIQVTLNLQVVHFRSVSWHYRQEKQKQNIEMYFRKRGISLYDDCSLIKAGYFGRNSFGDSDNLKPSTGLETFILGLSSKEHHSV
ncbi:hypothetical protein K7432_008316 [Basidiobolus ranarum]|uniref:Uncharacterized protein n=1 Tax=Basidiobolus ranarum TaxID=34480 RepID=A0ABR2WRY3_9FUNG